MTALALVVAAAENRVIGRDGGLPWRLPEDLKHFRRLTIGKTVLMGRKTWDTLGKPLSERDNWVLTRDREFTAPGARVFGDLSAVLDARPEGELMVIGGAELYRQTLPLATRIELTRVHAQVEGDTLFPTFDTRLWRETARTDHPADERHVYPFSFITLLRLNPV